MAAIMTGCSSDSSDQLRALLSSIRFTHLIEVTDLICSMNVWNLESLEADSILSVNGGLLSISDGIVDLHGERISTAFHAHLGSS